MISYIPSLSYIPSPSSSSLAIGPATLRVYGLMLALGIVAGLILAQHRWVARKGDPEQITLIAVWVVPAGLVGARMYHVLTDWKRYHYDNGWLEAFAIWKGGLGIPGAIAVGMLTGLLVVRNQGINRSSILDAVVPSLPLGQAIGRFGNFFNQELFGLPTNLPWGLQIDVENRPEKYMNEATFHPTFLYEAIWNSILCVVLISLDRRRVLKPGSLFAIYAYGYGLGRLWIEALRVDSASLILGVRVNIWMSLALIIGSLLYLIRSRAFGHQQAKPETQIEAAPETVT